MRDLLAFWAKTVTTGGAIQLITISVYEISSFAVIWRRAGHDPVEIIGLEMLNSEKDILFESSLSDGLLHHIMRYFMSATRMHTE
jgi:hypothetical protein